MVASLHVDGLTEALRGLAKVDREAGSAARDLLKESAATIQKAAQARLAGRPGGGTYPRRTGMVGRSASNKGGGISLKGSRYPWAWGAEFGARRAWVYGKVNVQSNLRRRQFPIWRGNQFVVRGRGGPGWIIQPTIRAHLDRELENIANGLERLIDRALTESGSRG